MVDQLASTQLSNREFFIRRWGQEYPAFMDVCKALPADRLDYRPHAGSRSAAELVALLVTVGENCLSLCSTGQASFASGLALHPTIKVSTIDEMISTYEQHHRSLSEALTNMTDATWNRPAWLKRDNQEIVLKDTVGGLLWIALFDAVHHRGQLSTYIRPMGGRVPSIYGPSADAPAR
jgi:uncharacterized damage-inducible protein DinB